MGLGILCPFGNRDGCLSSLRLIVVRCRVASRATPIRDILIRMGLLICNLGA